MGLAHRALSFAGGFGACTGGAADVEGGPDATTHAPDVAGTYDAVWEAPTGCEGTDAPLGWVDGPLDVTGPHDALVFDFGELALDGAVDSAFAFTAAGAGEVDGWALDVVADGIVYLAADVWVLEGPLAVSAAATDGSAVS